MAKQKKPPRKLTPKQERFAAEYLVDLDATRAAIAAGYSQKTASVLGHQLLKNPFVQAAIAKGQAAKAKRIGINADRVLQELALIAFADIKDAFDEQGKLLPIPQMPEHIRRAITGIEYDRWGNPKIKLSSKDSALEKFFRHLGLFADETINLNLKGQVNVKAAAELSDDDLARIAAGGK